MIFQHTYDLVLAGKKTRTTRTTKPGETLVAGIVCHNRTWHVRTRFRVGNTYAVQTGRGRPSIGRIRIIAIREVNPLSDVTISYAKKEGFLRIDDFRDVWFKMYPDWKAGMTAWCIDFEAVK